MSHGGKGDTPRPLSISQKEFNERHETIFGKKVPKVPYVYVPEETKETLVNNLKDSKQSG
jgi:hypothetical protein